MKSSSPPRRWTCPASFAAKFAWLGRRFPFIPPSHIVFCGDKSVIAADYLIDDEPRHLAPVRRRGGILVQRAAESAGDRPIAAVDSFGLMR